MLSLVFLFVCLQSNGDTVLHLACRRKDHELVKLFVENSIDVNAQNVSEKGIHERGGVPLFHSYEMQQMGKRGGLGVGGEMPLFRSI